MSTANAMNGQADTGRCRARDAAPSPALPSGVLRPAIGTLQ
ncbi:hypothetical protein XOCgx_4610 [Xanthomonas oryzae pv. oryzicola]|nr:hypothetical protein XOCgx_4610 [Xanthomonas oryzae pv. oryzicola]